jgi:hypothetical protein
MEEQPWHSALLTNQDAGVYSSLWNRENEWIKFFVSQKREKTHGINYVLTREI